MANTKTKRIPSKRRWTTRLGVAAWVCLATLAGGPVSAATTDVVIPAVPLQSGTPYPAPNIMFILDDSGSMTYSAMPADVSSYDRLNDNIQDKSYVHNTLYYDPSIDYLPWKLADGSRLTGGTGYSAAYTSANLASGSTTDLGYNTQTYFVPKPDATDLNDPSQYDKYEIRSVGGTLRVVKSGADVRRAWNNQDIGEYGWWYGSIDVPDGVTSLDVTIRNGNGGNAELYVRRGNKPTTGTYDARDTGWSNTESVSIANPAAGTWWIGVYNNDGGRGNNAVNNEDILAVAANSTFETPTGRTEAEEMTNFATWYSYHRTRMKVAKYAASEAFSQLGDNYRVGFDSIWNRSQGVTSNDSPPSAGQPAYPIPTGVDEGLFKGENRKKWFEYLHSAQGSNGTPLHDALWRAGKYYESGAPWKSGATADISCRLSFSILTTDGYWNSRSQTGSGAYGGNTDGTSGSTISRPAGAAGGSYKYTPVRPYEDSRAGTLADVAMNFWKRDLRTDLINNVPTSTADEAFWQHMVTFGVAIGLAGELDPEDDLVDLTSGAKQWPDPMLGDTSGSASYPSRIDDLFHATVDSRGAFVSASDPARFVNGLLGALTTISERPGSASNVTANSTSFTSDTRVYQASYTSGTWTGELTAYVATSAGIQPTPAWKGSQGIPKNYKHRSIWTWDAAAGGGGAAFPTAEQVTALDVSSRSGSGASGADNAAYIAGDKSGEPANDGKLRARTSVLGDIVNSSPIYVNDSGALFVGANDGMLHAFDGDTGEELFAYVPGGIDLGDLASLSDPNYGRTVTHKYFVDGPIAVSAKSQTPGKNILVGALGRGGRGVFALDVTNPTSFDDNDVLWESGSDNDMGMVLGDPLIVTLNDASKTKAVVVGNGINSPDGSATLFVFNLETGEEIREIEAGTAGGNGLFAPRGWDDNGDGTVDYIYAGDLAGNLWKFDLRDGSTSNWKVANSGDPMFQARDALNQPQPITAGLALARNPDTRDVWVFFGTGRFLTIDDLETTEVQTLYGIKDEGIVAGRTSDVDFGDLVKREIVAVSDDYRVRAFEEWKRTMEPDKKGWFLDLDEPYKGERVVSGLRLLGTTLIASSIIPGTGSSSCDAGGTGYINALDAFTGTSPAEAFFDINGDGVVNDDDRITTTIDGKEVSLPAGSIDLGIGMPTRATIIDKLLVVGGSGGGLGSVTINPQGVGARRVSWREILRD